MAGIVNIKSFLSLVFSATEGLVKSLGDGKIDLGDALNLFDVLKDLGPAIESLPNLKKEFFDLSSEEKEELNSFIREDFDIPNNEVENVVEKAFEAVFLLADIAKIFKGKKK